MTNILLVGSDAALLEGLAQTLAAVGRVPRIAHSFAQAVELCAHAPPLIAVLDREMVDEAAGAVRLPLVPGGALLVYHVQPISLAAPLPRAVQRLTLAELTLPLERQRLVALVQHVEERAMHTGRSRRTPPETQRSV